MSDTTTDAVLSVNGELHAWQPGLTLAGLLRARGDDDATVATAVNGTFVPRSARAVARLSPADEILVFAPIVGG